MADKVHLHAGHRERLREQFLSAGTDIFRAHQILELLLFYSVPRRDTNDLAHALIDHFGSAFRVLTANQEELTAVKGIGAHTAEFIVDYREFVAGALEETSQADTPDNYDRAKMIERVLLEHYDTHRQEHAIMLFLNNHFDIFDIQTVTEGSIHSARFHPKDAVRMALHRHAALIVIAHNHPTGLAVPTREDRLITEELERHFNLMGIKLIDHFLVANSRAVGLLFKEVKEHNENLSLRFSANCFTDVFSNTKLPHTDMAAAEACRESSVERQKHLLAKFLSYAVSKEKASEWSERAFSAHPHLQAICAQPLDWLEASGLPRSAAALLKLALPSYAACLLKSHRDAPISNAQAIGSTMALRCMTLTGESVFLLLFDEKMRQISFTRVSDGVVNSTEVSTRRIAEIAYFSHARYAVLVHNHPFGTTVASQNDVISTYTFSEALDMVNCTLLEHFIVSGNRFSPLILLLKGKDAPAFAVKDFYGEAFLEHFPTI